MNENHNLDFDELLLNGASSYDNQIANWWIDRTQDKAHQQAYRDIAELIFAKSKLGNLKPKFIVDYACGSGSLFPHLERLFPESFIIGIDGSLELLKQMAHNHPNAEIVNSQDAFNESGPKFRLVHSALPNFQDFESHQADIALLSFPNLLPDDELVEVFNDNGYGHEEDNEVAHCLARYQEMDPELRNEEEEDPEFHFDELMSARVFSRNLHHLLKPNGLLCRVEYSNCHRSELSQLTKWRSLFSEGALGSSINDTKAEVFFNYQESYYRPSEVILDVYHQTKDEGDKEGGYCVHFFNRDSG